MIELSNGLLTIKVAEKGAELQSVRDNEGREYMWQAGPNGLVTPLSYSLWCVASMATPTVSTARNTTCPVMGLPGIVCSH